MEQQEQPWTEFKRASEQLQGAIGTIPVDPAAMRATFAKLQLIFQDHIATFSGEQCSEPEASRIQSLQVEMDKQIRLLGLDINFLQAARQSATVQQRRSQMGDRLNLLATYSEALFNLFDRSNAEGI